MKKSSDNVDLVIAAAAISLVLHALLMFFAAPQVMSQIGVSSATQECFRRQPMAVRKFEGDPLRAREKTLPKSDAPAPRSAPKVASVGDGMAPLTQSNAQVLSSPPAIELPEVSTGPADTLFEMPKPSVAKDASFVDPMPYLPMAPLAPSVPLPSSPSPSADGSGDSSLPTPMLAVPAPEVQMPQIDGDLGETHAMAGVEPSKSAANADYAFDNKVLDSVSESFVEREKAAVRALLSAPDVAPMESSVACSMSACIDPADPRWRYFSLEFSPKTGPDELPVVPKDAVILIDASGSIGTDRLRNCRNAAKEILRSCFNSGDRFNLVAFRNRFSYAFREWRECNAQSFGAADRWLSQLTAHGRTDVFSVIRSVLTLPRDPSRPLIALVVTDGDANAGVSGTAEILSRFTALNDGLVSVYMYGVKKEGNRELIDLLTRGNRGESFIHEGNRRKAGIAMESLAASFRDPVLTDLRIMFSSGSMAETYPKLLKNLYRGGTVVLHGRCPAKTKELVFTLKGLSGSKAFESLYKLDFSSAKASGTSLIDDWRSDRIVAGLLLR